jgi:serine/threonine-protein kinase
VTPPEPTDVDALVADFIQALERGQAPNPADWLARHPAHADELAAFLLDLGRFGSFLGLPDHSGLEATTAFTGAGTEASCAQIGAGGSRFAEYELLEEIGQGGMGTVYRARLIPTSLVVALKRIRPGGLAGAEAARLFREEVETAAALRHPNIVPIYHVGEHDGQPFYTMALVERGSLDRHRSRFQGDFRRTAELVARIARAVHYAHQRRILHRDLKPGNVLLDADWLPQVGDFGLAGRLDESGGIAAEGPPMGSLPWMAPEAVRGDTRLTTGVDIWALGVILYELLTGARPFQGSDRQAMRSRILEQEPAAPRSINPRLPRDLDAVCRRCLHRAPDQRYESANALALDLERWLRDEPVRVRTAGKAERFVRWCRRNPVLAVGTAVLLACLVAGMAAGLSVARAQTSRLEEAVCASNEFAARGVASTVQLKLADLAGKVTRGASNPDLCRACGKGDPAEAAVVLRERFHGSPFATVYLLDSSGRLVAHADPAGTGRGRLRSEIEGWTFPGRDYFLGALRHEHEEEVQNRVHVSRAFESENDKLDKIALSCPVRPDPAAILHSAIWAWASPRFTVADCSLAWWAATSRTAPWVLAATITTDPRLGLDSLTYPGYRAVLLAPRDTRPPRPGAPGRSPGYVIMVHPAFTKGVHSVTYTPPCGGHVPPADGKPELRVASSTDPPFLRCPDDIDPVDADGGRMLTGSARVANTELVVLVQQRYDAAVTPHQGEFHRFAAWVASTVAVGFVSLVLLRWLAARRGRAGKVSVN